ncbi:peptidoglycan DD-metalloendopeptidase family protein [Synechococcales cyanobacterium C]|uniref:Peptidoglycan DD-metalloendopeptidase family protein n=1 Tax=Petrachloros mirabilis ULC683 TaxID=2781853 RepID=A0A8K1ZXZ9_9CYAN|nr:M23 family metallopeptidase [Petrachloros mirabilis]NCJ07365.1 peptidoglycan DD-metalloendopeptidase family protein [Petrachloros mirabilis ULC683]
MNSYPAIMMLSSLKLTWLPAILLMFSPVLTTVATALQVTVRPERVNLGDTLKILVEPEPGETLTEAPTVKVAGESVPVFALGNHRWRALVPTTPLEQHGRRSLVVTGNNTTRNMLVWVGDRRFPTQSIWLREGGPQGTDHEFDRMDALRAMVTPQKFWNGTFRRPTSGPVTTGYGIRRYYNGVFANDYYHRGLDYAAPTGTPVIAAAAGRVAVVGRESDGFLIHGNTIGLDHGQGVTTVYLHLSRIDVREGDMVQAGQVIGAVGNTGASTGPHLHWGLNVNGKNVDPQPWLSGGFE